MSRSASGESQILVSHLLNQLPHGLPRFSYQLVTGNSLLFVEVQHLLLEDVVGKLGFDLPDAILRQIRLPWFFGPRHHMHMGMVALIMEGSVPAEVLGRNVHGGGNIVAVGAEEIPPRPGVVIAQPLRVLPFQGDDVRPHISGVVLQLLPWLCPAPRRPSSPNRPWEPSRSALGRVAMYFM